MAQCAKCGMAGDGVFCAGCGSPMPVAPKAPSWAQGQPAAAQPPQAPPPPNYPPPPPPGYQAPPQYQQPGPQQGYPQQGAPQAAGMEDNVAGALCYVLGVLTGVLFLFLEPYNKNREIKFHAFQAIFFWAGAVVATIATSIIGTLVAFLPYIGWIISLLLWTLIPLGVFGVWALLIYKAYNKEHWLLPILGPLAEKQAYTS